MTSSSFQTNATTGSGGRPPLASSRAGAAAGTPSGASLASTGAVSPRGAAAAPRVHPRGTPYEEEESRFAHPAIFGAGIAVGALLGAGIALLLAPQSGSDTRRLIARGARDLRGRAGDAWFDLGDELRNATHRSRRRLHRKATRARWAAADLVEG